jgi:hypothetical protein
VIGDRSVEPDEGFTVTLTNAVNGTIDSDNNSAEGVILDDDGEQLPLVSIANASQPEGNSGEANLVFMVSLSTPVGETVTVDYATADGTAAAGTDYTAVSGTLTFASGDTEQTISAWATPTLNWLRPSRSSCPTRQTRTSVRRRRPARLRTTTRRRRWCSSRMCRRPRAMRV